MKYANFFVLTVLAISLSLHGCKKVGGVFKGAGRQTGRTSTKAMGSLAKVGTVLIFAAGASVITLEVLEESFKDAPDNKEPINASFLNKSMTEDIDLNVTLDGSTWYQTTVEPQGKYEVNSTGKGIIGVNHGDNFFKIDKSNLFFIDKIAGDFKLSD